MAAIIEVCSNCSINSISKAVKMANNGDTILVKEGIYQEVDIVIDKPITLKGEKGAVIDGQGKGEIILVTADDVTIDGLEIINVGSSHLEDYSAVRLREVENFIVENLIIRNPFFAIYLEKSNHGTVRNNKVYGTAESEFTSGNGIQLWYSHYNTLDNNELDQMRDGIYFEFSNHNVITNNISKNSVRYGLHFMFSNNDLVKGNSYLNNGAGIAIMFSKEMEMYHNIFKDNWGAASYGVLLKEATDAKITHNVFERNTTALNIEGSTRILYENNDFISNGWAVNSRGANYKNEFTKNNFLNNSFDIAYKGGMNENTFNGNYWSEYNGYDLDRDGIGDVPYRPVKLFSYLVNKSPEAIILLRSMFIDIVDFSERVSPVFTPDNLLDETPLMKKVIHD